MRRRSPQRTPQAASASDGGPGEQPATTAVAFPGQGVDPGDLIAVLQAYDTHPLVTALGERLGLRAWADVDLSDTRVGQPCVYTAGLVTATDAGHGLVADTDGSPRADLVVFGHSLGELTAAAFAGACTPEAGLDLVRRRADLAHARDLERPGQMVVVMRLDETDVEWVRREVIAKTGLVLEVAVSNGTGQFVLSGDLEATTIAIDVAAEMGGVARPLPIGGGYHSPLLAPIVGPYAEALESAITRAPSIPLVSCTSHRLIRGREALVTALARALVLPVRWTGTLEAVAATGVVQAIDAGPSHTLTNLAKYNSVLPFRSLRP